MIRDIFIITIIIISVIIGTIYTQNLLGENTDVLLKELGKLETNITKICKRKKLIKCK